MAYKIIDGKANKCKFCIRGMKYIEKDVVHICCLVRSHGSVCRYERKEKNNG